MGNSNSLHHQVISPQWVQSYPRPRHLSPQVKVLPERIPPLRLRTTDNGAILQNGGTISGRKQSVTREEKIYRPRSSSAHRPPRPEDINLDKTRFGSEPDLRFPKESREQFSENAIRQRISRSRKKYKAPPAPQNGSGLDSSSPDLNGWESHNGDYMTPGRKTRLFKTRAETNKRNLSQKKPEASDVEEQKTNDVPVVPRIKNRDDFRKISTTERKDRIEPKPLIRSTSQEVITSKRSLATPEFQAELKEAAQRLRPNSAQTFNRRESPITINAKHQIEKAIQPRVVDGSKGNENYQSNKPKSQNDGVKAKGRQELSGIQKSLNLDSKKFEKVERDVPSKKFYFGMEQNNNDIKIVNNYGSTNNVDKTNAEHRITAVEKSKNLMNIYKSVTDPNHEWEESLEKFAATYHKTPVTLPNGNTTSCSSSFVSDPDEDVDGGIALQLRPTLPKKQLEIPRFSPTAAWRLLSSIETIHPTASSPDGSDDSPVILDERINEPLSQQVLRHNHDKSGDSGISGDASPGGCHETFSELAVTSAKTLATQNSKSLLMAWTPQQDLEEESSSDDFESPLSSSKNATSNIPGAKFSPRGQLFSAREQNFSLSLPRDESLGQYIESEESKGRCSSADHTSKFNSLKKLKAALGSNKRNGFLDDNTINQDGNWVLSRSVPSSLNNGGHGPAIRSISNPSSPDQDDESLQQGLSLKYPSYSYLANGGRMMYLPEYHSRLSPDVAKNHNNMKTSGLLSKSCENISSSEMRQIGRTPSPVVSQNTEERYHTEGSGHSHKKKKFTFQSTVRLIENKRIAERLSREAELKESQRLSELEAMKKVEEEFQKKRAREKANIRHQLRLFTLEEKNYSSLPPIDWGGTRVEPEGAPNSLPTASQSHGLRKTSMSRKSPETGNNKYTPTTQVLSEYREPMRDYRDYRISRYHDVQEQAIEPNRRSIVEHPRVVYDMPKSTAVFVSAHSAQNMYDGETRGTGTPRSSSSDNYRKDFAHGALPVGGRSLASSDSELSQSQRPISRQGVKLSAVQRSRSASPESSRSMSPEGNHCSRSSSSSPLRSSSVSPTKIASDERSNSRTPDCLYSRDNSNEPENLSASQIILNSKRKLSASANVINDKQPENSFSDDRGMGKFSQDCRPININDLPRIGLSSLQPFKKTEKSFRPISFNPMNNKLAQPVN